MSQPSSSEDLRHAFQAMARGHRPAAPDAVIEEVWQATRGKLAQARVRELLNRSISEPELAEAFRLAAEVQREMPALTESRRSARSKLPARLAAVGAVAAAVIAVALLLPVFQAPGIAPAPGDANFRNDAELVIRSEQDGGASLPRDRFELSWTAGPDGTLYDLEVAGEDLAVLHRAEALTESRYTVPVEALKGVPAGARLLWVVEATRPGGRRATSQTFVVVVE